MTLGAARAALVFLLLAAAAECASAAKSPDEPYDLVRQLISHDGKERKKAARQLRKGGDETLIPALVDAFFFTTPATRGELEAVLEHLTGARFERYYSWVEYVGGRKGLRPAAGYAAWKLSLLERIDPRYVNVVYSGAPSRIRLEEVVWGGVRLGGIPALDDPPTLAAGDALYLDDDEKVFGVALGGEARAYPLRILSWHELLNDVVGQEPVSLSYCTLCGSGILYGTSSPDGGSYRFDTSGLLYRSNKLMVDRRTWTLWSNILGEPVFGRLASTAASLRHLPMTLTTWRDWRRRHPDTSVLDLGEIERRYGSRFGYDYRPGAADQARTGVSFPVWQKSDRLPRDEEIFALRLDGASKAYPLAAVLAAGVVNDDLGERRIVLIGDPESGSVRAYERGEARFALTAAGALEDDAGGRWRIAEAALEPLVADVEPLSRLPGHVAFWFGWYGFHPDTEVYEK